LIGWRLPAAAVVVAALVAQAVADMVDPVLQAACLAVAQPVAVVVAELLLQVPHRAAQPGGLALGDAVALVGALDAIAQTLDLPLDRARLAVAVTEAVATLVAVVVAGGAAVRAVP